MIYHDYWIIAADYGISLQKEPNSWF